MSSLIQPAHADPLQRFWNDSLDEADPEVAAIIGRELGRQARVAVGVEHRGHRARVAHAEQRGLGPELH